MADLGAETGDAAAAVADPGDRASDAATIVLPECPQVDDLRVPSPNRACLDPAKGWQRPNQAKVDQKLQEIATRLGASEHHVTAFVEKLRNPKAIGKAPPDIVHSWVEVLAKALNSNEFDYANRFAYAAFNLQSAFPLAAMNSWGCPSDINMVTNPQHVRDGADAPAIDSQYTTFSGLLCMTKVWENAYVESIFCERDVDGDYIDGHVSFNECPGYKAADRSKYADYFDQGTEFPPPPVNFGAFPPDELRGPNAYVLQSGIFPLYSINGKEPNLRTLDLIKRLGGTYEKMDDAFARALGSRYGINSIEYADKTHYGVYFVFIPNPASESRGHMMLLTLNPQFGVTASGAYGGGSGAHAELLLILKTQADVIRCLSDSDVLLMDGAHPLWRLVGDRGMRSVFPVAREMREADERGERYATRHVRVGGKTGFFGTAKTPEQIEKDYEMARENARKTGFFGTAKTPEEIEKDFEMARETGRKTGFGGSSLTKEEREAQLEANKRGGAAHIRDMPTTTCPMCGASDVRLTWVVRGVLWKAVRYVHVRCNAGGKTGTRTKSCKIGDEEAWRKFLGALGDEQFAAHKEDVLREAQR